LEDRVKKATKLKITIVDDEKKINLPGIPFWLIEFLIDLGFGLSSIALKFIKEIDEDTKKILDSIDRKDIKQMIKELKKYGPFELVNIREGDKTYVHISIL